MPSFKESAEEFLAQKRIAVVGVSRNGGTANGIYNALRKRDYQLFPINPNTEMIEGDKCYPNLKALPSAIDGVMVVTRPEVAEKVMEECVELKIPRVWMHENALFGAAMSSVSKEAAVMGKENGLTVIAGGCPMMFMDFGHKCMRWILGATGKLPKD